MGATKWDPRSLGCSSIGACQRWVAGFLHADRKYSLVPFGSNPLPVISTLILNANISQSTYVISKGLGGI